MKKEVKGSYNLIKTGDIWGVEKSKTLVKNQLEDVFVSMLVEARSKEAGIPIEKYCELICELVSEAPLDYTTIQESIDKTEC